MSAPDPGAIIRHARLLIDTVDDAIRHDLVDDYEAALAMFDITVEEHFNTAGCDLDASWNRNTRTIRIDADASPSRRRFSALHEFGHERIDESNTVNDWLFSLGEHDGSATEAVCDAFAAELLLPSASADEHLAPGFKARDVKELFETHSASREAVCVRAAQRLGAPGLIVLAWGPTVLFSSSRSLPFRIGRGVDQPESSVITRASKNGFATTGSERVQLRRSRSFTDLTGDATRTDDGYTFAVLRHAADDVDHHGRSRAKTWTCGECGEDITDGDWCSRCERRTCPDCGCRCPSERPEPKRAVCTGCFLELPVDPTECPNCGQPVA